MGNIDPIEAARIINYHKELLKIYKITDSNAMGWAEDSQLIRFKILSEIADLNNKSVLDIGCGNGNLYDFLKKEYPTLRYAGLDLLDEFLEHATSRINSNEVQFFKGNYMSDQLPMFDYFILCGSLNYKSENPLHIFESINHLFKSARLGLGFNLLSKVPENQEIAMAYNSKMVFEFCKMLTNKCTLKEGYLNNDYTIFMYH